MSLTPLLAILSLLLLVYRYIITILSQRRFNAFALAHNCKPALDTSKTWTGTLKRIRQILNMRSADVDFIDEIPVPEFSQANTSARKGFAGGKTIATVEPANIQALLAGQFDDFETGEARYRAVAPLLGRSIFSSDGSFWKHSRNLFRPQFSRANINDLEATETAARTLIEAIELSGSDGLDMLPLFYNLTIDTATDFLFGESVGAQVTALRKAKLEKEPSGSNGIATLATSDQFAKEFDMLGQTLQKRVALQIFGRLVDGFEFRRTIARTRQFAEHYIAKAMDKPVGESKKDQLLSSLIQQTQDRNELCNQTLALLFAGRDTTAALLGWCVIRLALHRDIYDNLRRTIFSDIDTRPTTFAQLKSCRPLQHFINEVLRLHPVVPFNARVAAKDTTLPRGGGPDLNSPIAVPKGANVLYSVYVMHRRKDLWGEDALEFKPSRWERRLTHPWQYLPFNGGPRICLGMQFALMETSYVLVRLLERYEGVQPVDGGEMARMRKGIGLAVSPRDGVKVRWVRSSQE